jgi:hypothetical protein
VAVALDSLDLAIRFLAIYFGPGDSGLCIRKVYSCVAVNSRAGSFSVPEKKMSSGILAAVILLEPGKPYSSDFVEIVMEYLVGSNTSVQRQFHSTLDME